MPIEKPTVDDIWNKLITFVSIDTDILQSKGFQFDRGALNQLPNQLPDDVHLVFTQVVHEEVKKHRLDSVSSATRELASALKSVHRHTGEDLGGLTRAVDALNIVPTAETKFENELHDYAARCGGSILPWSSVNGEELFEDYFKQKPPFEDGKKFEFPDAASLQILEGYAKSNETCGIVISGDGGWERYAAQSDRLYHFKSLDELTALFVATGKSAAEVEAKIKEHLANPDSAISKAISKAMATHVSGAEWDSSGYHPDAGDHLEMEVFDATMISLNLGDDIEIWRESDQAWVAQLSASVDVSIHAAILVTKRDSIDREETVLVNESVEFPYAINVTFYIRMNDVRLDVGPDQWDVEVDIAYNEYYLGDVVYPVF